MKDEEKIEFVHGVYEAWNRRDLRALLETVDPAYELVQADEVLGGATYRGREGFTDLFEQFADIWAEFIQEPTEIEIAGDRAAVRIHQRGKGKGSGIEVEQDVGHLLEFRGPVVLRTVTYSDPDEAFRALRP